MSNFDNEYLLPSDSTCTHHEDERAVTVLDGEPLCAQCRDDYVDTFKERRD